MDINKICISHGEKKPIEKKIQKTVEETVENEEINSGSVARVLPMDVLIDILSRVPIKTLKHCTRVCMSWYRLIHSPSFTQLQHEKALQRSNNHNSVLVLRTYGYDRNTFLFVECDLEHGDKQKRISNDDNGKKDGTLNGEVTALNTPRVFKSVDVVGTCNGLICFYSDEIGRSSLYVGNPIVGEYMILPQLQSSQNNFASGISYGFGFDSVTNKFKVVRIVLESTIEVYTLGSGMWRRVGDAMPYQFGCRRRYYGLFMNGALHWLMTIKHIPDGEDTVIVSFDLNKEIYDIFPQPPDFDENPDLIRHGYLCALKGCICIADLNVWSSDYLTIWMMKEYGVKQSWSKEYVVERPFRTGRPVGDQTRINLVPLTLMWNHLLFETRVYNTVDKSFHPHSITGIPLHFGLFTHVGSLISLKDAGGMTRNEINGSKVMLSAMFEFERTEEAQDVNAIVSDKEVALYVKSGLRSYLKNIGRQFPHLRWSTTEYIINPRDPEINQED